MLYKGINIYYIYYGYFTASQKQLIETYTNNMGKSPWWGITMKYYYQESEGAVKHYVTDNVTVAKTVQDNYSKGNRLHGTLIPELIQDKIDSGELPEDSDAVYFVLGSKDVKEELRDDLGTAAFCHDYCGYHVSWKLKSGKRIYYAFGGLPTDSRCLAGNLNLNATGCSINTARSPNNDPLADSLINVIAHEIAEAASDPFSDSESDRAWEDKVQAENADKCAVSDC